ncbi:MAG: low specificity L-threonine aldolase [Fibrella sp.]|nr:low specificity L-threonine aldolase [Armatimonadota bacterium]
MGSFKRVRQGWNIPQPTPPPPPKNKTQRAQFFRYNTPIIYSTAATTTQRPFIDLSSDTATRPTDAMRTFMASARVGDDQRGEDPTVNTLQAEAAALLGKDAALFLPSATLANQIAIRVLTRPGDEVYCHEHAHIRLYEGGGPAVLSGVQLCPLPGVRGTFTAAVLRDAVRPPDPHFARPRLVCLENTHNFAGGTVWRRDDITSVAQTARELGLFLHLDGSRLLNAATKMGVPAAEIVEPFDMVTLCLSKGLGAPVGAILAGNRTAIGEARHWKHVFGAAMRQSGIIAAGGLYALRNHIKRLADDHANAAKLAEGLSEIPGLMLDPHPETNLVFVNIAGTGLSGTDAQTRLMEHGVRCSGGGHRLRFVTHLDVSASDIDRTIEVAREVFGGPPK